MGKLRDRAEQLGIEIDGRWSNGTLQRKIAEAETRVASEKARENEPEQPVAVRLLKNHHPAGWYEVVGHEDKEGRRLAGPMPPPMPGVEFPHKLWAGTVVKLAPDAAKALVDNMVEERVIDRDPTTREVIRAYKRNRRKPLAEALIDWSVEPAGAEAAAG